MTSPASAVTRVPIPLWPSRVAASRASSRRPSAGTSRTPAATTSPMPAISSAASTMPRGMRPAGDRGQDEEKDRQQGGEIEQPFEDHRPEHPADAERGALAEGEQAQHVAGAQRRDIVDRDADHERCRRGAPRQ